MNLSGPLDFETFLAPVALACVSNFKTFRIALSLSLRSLLDLSQMTSSP